MTSSKPRSGGHDWTAAFVERLRSALALLETKTRVSSEETSWHCVIAISGWAGDRDAEKAAAEYLVGIRMMMVSAALEIQASLLGQRETEAPMIRSNIHSIVGASTAELSMRRITEERNPWIAEGLWHLCLHLAQRLPAAHPPGTIIAVDYAHSSAKEQGFDVAALYAVGDGAVGVTIVETKAYESAASRAVTDAAALFRSIDQNRMDFQMRRAVQIMREALPPELQGAVTGAFWRNERACVPNPHYDIEKCGHVDWLRRREALSDLGVDARHVLLMPHPVSGFRSFFDRVADNMRDFAEEMADV